MYRGNMKAEKYLPRHGLSTATHAERRRDAGGEQKECSRVGGYSTGDAVKGPRPGGVPFFEGIGVLLSGMVPHGALYVDDPGRLNLVVMIV